MKTIFNKLLFAGMLIVSTTAHGQVSQSRFSASNSNPVTLTAQNGIVTSYQLGTMGTLPAICVGFKNTSNKELVFIWTLKDGDGKPVCTGNEIKLEAGQRLDVDKNPVLKTRLTFILNSGMKAEDYTTEITIKN
jgi:hypothetical protein